MPIGITLAIAVALCRTLWTLEEPFLTKAGSGGERHGGEGIRSADCLPCPPLPAVRQPSEEGRK